MNIQIKKKGDGFNVSVMEGKKHVTLYTEDVSLENLVVVLNEGFESFEKYHGTS